MKREQTKRFFVPLGSDAQKTVDSLTAKTKITRPTLLKLAIERGLPKVEAQLTGLTAE
jgi:hypothetical protein